MPRRKQSRPRSFKRPADNLKEMDETSDESFSNASFGCEALRSPDSAEKVNQNSETGNRFQDISGLYSCQLCSASFPSLILFVQHRKFGCTTAGNNMWTRFVLSSKSGNRPEFERESLLHQCPWCGVHFLKLSDLCKHKKAMHLDTQEAKEVANLLEDVLEVDSLSEDVDRCEFMSTSKDHINNNEGSQIHSATGDSQENLNMSQQLKNTDKEETTGESPALLKYFNVSNASTSKAMYKNSLGYLDLSKELLKRERTEEVVQSYKKWKAFYPCIYCPIEFTELSTLKIHVETIHKRPVAENSTAVLLCNQNQKSYEDICELNEGDNMCNENAYVSKTHTVANFPSVSLTSFKDFGTFFLESSLQPLMVEGNYKHVSTMAKYLSHSIEYGCSSCLRSFPKADELQRHLMDLHACHLYRCSLCKLIFDSKVEIQVHFAVKHSNECTVFKCKQCLNSSFKTEVEWRLHVRIYHLGFSNPFRCLFCKDTFGCESELINHISMHEKQFPCPGCDETFMTENLLERHLESRQCSGYASKKFRQGPPISSPICRSKNCADIKFNVDADEEIKYTIDKKSSSPKMKNQIKCQLCGVKFFSEVDLKNHQEQNHSVDTLSNVFTAPENMKSTSPCNPEKVLQCCFYCKQTFKSRMEMSKHMRNHHITPSTQKCNICDEIFSSSLILAEHKLTHCKVIQSNFCTVCKTTLGGEDEFYSHCNNHCSQGSSMQCIICRQTLFSGLEMELHGRHHFQKNAAVLGATKCDLCYMGFEPKNDAVSRPIATLKNGVLNICFTCYHKENFEPKQLQGSFQSKTSIDHSVKTYQCIKCQESFTSEYEIQLHVTNHMINEGNRHECLLCLTTFESPAKLQLHLIEHSFPDKSHISCDICTQTFSKASDIYQHMLSNHGLITRGFNCSECPLSFFFCAELENHRLTSHNHLKHSFISSSLTDLMNISREVRLRNKVDKFNCVHSIKSMEHAEDGKSKSADVPDIYKKIEICQAFGKCLEDQTQISSCSFNKQVDILS